VRTSQSNPSTPNRPTPAGSSSIGSPRESAPPRLRQLCEFFAADSVPRGGPESIPFTSTDSHRGIDSGWTTLIAKRSGLTGPPSAKPRGGQTQLAGGASRSVSRFRPTGGSSRWFIETALRYGTDLVRFLIVHCAVDQRANCRNRQGPDMFRTCLSAPLRSRVWPRYNCTMIRDNRVRPDSQTAAGVANEMA